MVEAEAKELSEEIMLGAVVFGQKSYHPVIRAIVDLAEQCAKDPWPLPEEPAERVKAATRLRELAEAGLRQAYGETRKQLRHERIGAVKAQALETMTAEQLAPELAGKLFKPLETAIVA